eukprot:TRINITY_DN3067_c0_g1_i4.p1 TRINITY_DN3067_c0_g1~~TRINITY_DN3067_c0_g1_i4.p1  ORF type:complete len:131 (+),score=11.54 TRINITY_DN3067_c0_g1_i4:87-479(+)
MWQKQFGCIVGLFALYLICCSGKKIDDKIETIDGKHAKLLLSLFEMTVRNTTYHRFFENAPEENCCTVWKYLQCAEIVHECYENCTNGPEQCMQCVGSDLWPNCCCCVQTLGLVIQCPQCCSPPPLSKKK